MATKGEKARHFAGDHAARREAEGRCGPGRPGA